MAEKYRIMLRCNTSLAKDTDLNALSCKSTLGKVDFFYTAKSYL